MKVLFLLGFLFSLCSSLFAQKLSTESVDVDKNSTVEIVLVNEAVDDAVAMQFTLALPKELTVDESSISRGSDIEAHEMEWRRTNDNSFLFVFYNMDNEVLPSGELLRVPIQVGEQEDSYTCEVRSIRSSNVENTGSDAGALTFNINVSDPVGITTTPTDGRADSETLYDLQGRPVQPSQAAKHTIYILNGKKILTK